MQTILVIVVFAIVAGLGQTQDMPTPGACGRPSVKPNKPSLRIVNGAEAIPHSRNYQVLLISFYPNGTAKQYCGASFLKNTHVLTAAHCVVGDAAENIYLFPGLHDFPKTISKEGGIPARTVVVHKDYNAGRLKNDIAMIRLSQPVVVDNQKIGLICLPQTDQICDYKHPVAASGWGSMSGSPNRTSASRPTKLQEVHLMCTDHNQNADCKTLTHLIGLLKENGKICAFAPGKSVCFGDSGGPLVRERQHTDGQTYLEQVGIMSGTIDCSFTKHKPDVYADVIYFKKWILDQVKATL